VSACNWPTCIAFHEVQPHNALAHTHRLTCAEIPDKEADPELYDLVAKSMIHGEPHE